MVRKCWPLYSLKVFKVFLVHCHWLCKLCSNTLLFMHTAIVCYGIYSMLVSIVQIKTALMIGGDYGDSWLNIYP
jgi:uncharacterized protein with PQ loop repeat